VEPGVAVRPFDTTPESLAKLWMLLTRALEVELSGGSSVEVTAETL
jgi:hypothetical protein